MTVINGLASRATMMGLLACALVLCVAAPAAAAERSTWRHKGGHYENVKGNKWVEKVGEVTKHFTEEKRTDEYVLIYCKKEDVYVRLFPKHAEVRNGKNGEWRKVYEGKWDK